MDLSGLKLGRYWKQLATQDDSNSGPGEYPRGVLSILEAGGGVGRDPDMFKGLGKFPATSTLGIGAFAQPGLAEVFLFWPSRAKFTLLS